MPHDKVEIDYAKSYHDMCSLLDRTEIERDEAREKGFHEGKEMAIMVILNAITSNSDMPMLALKTAIKALRNKTTRKVA